MVLVFHFFLLYDHSSLLFLFYLFLGFALHNIHAFHARLFLLLFSPKKKKNKKQKQKQNKTKNEEKERKMCFALFFLDLKSRLAILSLYNMFMYFV